MKRFDLKKFRSYLKTSYLGRECIYLDQIPSTSSYMKRISAEDLTEGTLCITDNQTAGRGQYRRQWNSAPFENLTFTICFKPEKADRLPLLTMACANAVLESLEKYMPQEFLHLKWPNDLIACDKKIGGVLTEATFLGQHPEKVLVGIALNVIEKDFKPGIRDRAISLAQITDKPLIREKILAELLASIEEEYQLWSNRSILLQRRINNRLEGYGQWVRIALDGKLQEGTYKFIGLGTSGELLLLNEALDVITFRHEQIRIIPGERAVSEAAPKTEK
ncbi:MAG TPA: biotin--[acetyl-CoA-carboxylase] ligase [Balneolaceae bacterium]|nr:biotin--[acetyl-CoA-carboxylase] ligase [Balneolaceae bacterium]